MKNLAVVFGGASAEHDVSILTGLKICKLLRRTYNLLPIYFSLDNKFYYLKNINFSDYNDKEKLTTLGKRIEFVRGSIYIHNKKKLKHYLDVDNVINCCHGGAGENGELYSYLKLNEINCSSGFYSNAICTNKYILKQVAKSLNINVKNSVLINSSNVDEKIKYIKENFKQEVIVKPNNLGSSIGIIKSNHTNIKEITELILHLDSQVIVEEYIPKIEELRCAIIVHKNTICFSQIEKIKLKNDIFSFEDKYVNKVSTRELPAKVSDDIKTNIYEICKRLHENLNFSGVVEFQFFYDKSEKGLYLNEVNTVPKNLCVELFEGLGISGKMMAEYFIEDKSKIKKQTYFNSDILYKIDL